MAKRETVDVEVGAEEKTFEYSSDPVVVSEPLEGNDGTQKVDYGKTTMNVVNDPARPADFKPGSQNS